MAPATPIAVASHFFIDLTPLKWGVGTIFTLSAPVSTFCSPPPHEAHHSTVMKQTVWVDLCHPDAKAILEQARNSLWESIVDQDVTTTPRIISSCKAMDSFEGFILPHIQGLQWFDVDASVVLSSHHDPDCHERQFIACQENVPKEYIKQAMESHTRCTGDQQRSYSKAITKFMLMLHINNDKLVYPWVSAAQTYWQGSVTLISFKAVNGTLPGSHNTLHNATLEQLEHLWKKMMKKEVFFALLGPGHVKLADKDPANFPLVVDGKGNTLVLWSKGDPSGATLTENDDINDGDDEFTTASIALAESWCYSLPSYSFNSTNSADTAMDDSMSDMTQALFSDSNITKRKPSGPSCIAFSHSSGV
ncbi:hypothetical protein BS47DRAFT_1365767 [Hydnum rufescens UP504]|uniref:Uncharacterized protein n=1 Tax=Hydnum rufescens UP504 TaxID=1448309 RepID=A0A9P6AMR7_9AGAM|nr:hypothetical protein BS47DRAFT_1365767 [Hydnum rufescens UP504]